MKNGLGFRHFKTWTTCRSWKVFSMLLQNFQTPSEHLSLLLHYLGQFCRDCSAKKNGFKMDDDGPLEENVPFQQQHAHLRIDTMAGGGSDMASGCKKMARLKKSASFVTRTLMYARAWYGRRQLHNSI